MINGVLIVDKPQGITSRDVVNSLMKKFNIKKIGHTGTLDPLATGVLVVTLGRYTKLNDVLTSSYKEYIATMKLGIITDTLDITGKVYETQEVSVGCTDVDRVLKSFLGTYAQEVPAYSAVKVRGKKLYEYARANEAVELPKRDVEIKEIELLRFDGDNVEFRVLVSKGTYIRSLIRDIGAVLGVGATMTSLRRIRQGKFTIDESSSLDDILNDKYSLLQLEDVLDLVIVECERELTKKVTNGVKVPFNTNKDFLLFRYGEKNLALYKRDGDIFRMFLKLD